MPCKSAKVRIPKVYQPHCGSRTGRICYEDRLEQIKESQETGGGHLGTMISSMRSGGMPLERKGAHYGSAEGHEKCGVKKNALKSARWLMIQEQKSSHAEVTKRKWKGISERLKWRKEVSTLPPARKIWWDTVVLIPWRWKRGAGTYFYR